MAIVVEYPDVGMSESQTEVAGHVATYKGFAFLAKLFGLHAVIDALGIILLIVGHTVPGLCCIAIGTIILAWAIITVSHPFDAQPHR